MRRAVTLGVYGCLAAWLVAATSTAAASPPPDGVAFFEQKIRPVLVKECYRCHSAGAKAVKGGLRLDSRAGVLAGGDSGPGGRAGQARREPAARRPAARRDRDAPQGQAARRGRRRLRALGPDRGAPTRATGRPPPRRSRGDRRRGRPRVLGLPAAPAPRRPRGRRRRLAARPTSTASSSPRWRRRGSGRSPTPTGRRCSAGSTSTSIGLPPTPEEIDAFVADPSPGRLRAAGRSPARLAPLRRALGPALARRGPLRRVADAPRASSSRTPGGTATTSSTPSTPTCPSTASSASRSPATCCPAPSLGRPPPAADRDDVPRPRQHQPRGAGQAAARMDVVDEQLDTIGKAFLARRSAAPAATTTSSTRSRPATTTPWPASSATPRPWSTPTSPMAGVPLPVPPSRRRRSAGTRRPSPISNRASRRPATRAKETQRCGSSGGGQGGRLADRPS